MTLVDTHCHLHFPDFDADRDAMVERARAAGVKGFVNVGTDPVTNEKARQVAAGRPDMVFSAGLHPHSAHEVTDEQIEGIAAWVREHRPAAIGEIGLDYFKSEGAPDVQKDRFRRMIRIALAGRIPVIVHSREASADTLEVLRGEGARQGVMHCFSYGREEMRAALDLGFYISFAGNTTFKNAAPLADAAAFAPLDRIVLETDSPYLAPPPNRGKRNEPAFVLETARFIAARRGIPVEALAEATTQNAVRLFGLRI
jgi:TatD DNase family protein